MLAAFVDDGGDRLAIDVIETATKQRKALGSQVNNWRRDVDLTVEPWLDRVLVARFHVHQVTELQRADMRRDYLVGDRLLLIIGEDRCAAREAGNVD